MTKTMGSGNVLTSNNRDTISPFIHFAVRSSGTIPSSLLSNPFCLPWAQRHSYKTIPHVTHFLTLQCSDHSLLSRI